MELKNFDPIDFKKFTDGKAIVKVSNYSPLPSWNSDLADAYLLKDTDMDPLVENEALLHIANGIEKASGATGVDIKVRRAFMRNWNCSSKRL